MNTSIKAKVLEILKIALDFNSEPTNKRTTGNKPTLFVEFSGHTCCLIVRCYPTGWHGSDSYELFFEYFKNDNSIVMEEKLNICIERMKEIISEWEGRCNEI